MEGFNLHLHHTVTHLQAIARDYAPAVFSTSLGAEDQVLTHLIAEHKLAITMVTLDTGRLHAQTYDLLARTEQRYKTRITVFTPERDALERYIQYNGVNGFYESITQRKDCCEVRKLQPLRRALVGARAWVTGVRAAQNVSRHDMPAQEFDAAFGVEKFNPLLEWSEDEVWQFIRTNDVPFNPLHDAGFPSIGCAPCTRAVQTGEDIRAGRWWWETADHKECGLHARFTLHASQHVASRF
jgi:phosphoadenosine phosphosulfate reductase